MNRASRPSVTYLVMAHNKPRQFAALALQLTRAGSRVLAHIDAKSDEEAFRSEVRHLTGVRFIDRRSNIRWGNFAVVDAELALLREATTHEPADYYMLLSGVDFPIKPEPALQDVLCTGAVYMNSWPMPSPENGKPLSRLERFHVATKKRDSVLYKMLNGGVFRVLPKRNVTRGLNGHQPYGGSQWWAMPHPVAVEVLRFVDRETRFVSFFRRSANPDEMMFQTIVAALPGPVDVRPSLTHADWTRPEADGASPATLSSADVARLEGRPEFVARKFDFDLYPETLPRVLDFLLRQASSLDGT